MVWDHRCQDQMEAHRYAQPTLVPSMTYVAGPVLLYEPLSWCVLKEFVDEYREQLTNLDTTLCGDAGASARCDNVDGKQASKGMLSSTQSGYFGSCAVNMVCACRFESS